MDIDKFGAPINESPADNLAFRDDDEKSETLLELRDLKMRMTTRFLVWAFVGFGIAAVSGLIYLYTLIRNP